MRISTISYCVKSPRNSGWKITLLILDTFSYRLESILQLMKMGKLPISGGGHLVTLFEDLHWILMITGKITAALVCKVNRTQY